jgi:hypothetical protein
LERSRLRPGQEIRIECYGVSRTFGTPFDETLADATRNHIAAEAFFLRFLRAALVIAAGLLVCSAAAVLIGIPRQTKSARMDRHHRVMAAQK